MRIGELVKTPDGRIGRVVDKHHSSGSVVVDFDGTDNGPWCEPEHLAVVTVADVFKCAGFPVPDNMIVAQMFGELNLFHDKGEVFEGSSGKQSVSDCYSFRETKALNGPKWGWIKDGSRGNAKLIDLSCLPASDAWDALPTVVRAAAEGVTK